jgi:membrane-associated phospholipid phosphatase
MSSDHDHDHDHSSDHVAGVGGNVGAALGAVPPELVWGPLTLQFYLGLNAPPSADFPILPILPSANWRPSTWDPSLYALLGLSEFVPNASWETIADGTALAPFLGWQTINAGFQAFVAGEIAALRTLMARDRERYLAEIITQHNDAPGYWIGLLRLDRPTYPWTLRVLSLASRIGEFVAIHAKRIFDRPRPSQVSPGLFPPFGPPAHPSFPSGHATQSRLIQLCLQEVTGGAASPYIAHLDWCCRRISHNRERGGFHYRSDTHGGWAMADACFGEIQTLLADPATNPRLDEIFTKAAGEWP